MGTREGACACEPTTRGPGASQESLRGKGCRSPAGPVEGRSKSSKSLVA